MNYSLKKLLGHEIFRSMVSWATKIILKICKTLRSPPLSPLVRIECTLPNQTFITGKTLA